MTQNNGVHGGDLHSLGTALSERILEFQARFAGLSEKCDFSVLRSTESCVSDNQVGVHAEGVGFKRDGKVWKLFFVQRGTRYRPPTDHEVMRREMSAAVSVRKNAGAAVCVDFEDWTELRQASLLQKSFAVSLLPELLTGMQIEYRHRIAGVQAAHDVLDQLNALIPPAPLEDE